VASKIDLADENLAILSTPGNPLTRRLASKRLAPSAHRETHCRRTAAQAAISLIRATLVAQIPCGNAWPRRPQAALADPNLIACPALGCLA